MRIPQLIPAAILLTLAVPAVHAQKTAKKTASQTQKPQAAPEAPVRQPAPSTPFADMDADHDGTITRAEWKGNAIGFAMLDTNSDGVLAGDELKPSSHAPAQDSTADTFAKLDRNHDGRLTRAEWKGEAKDFDLRDHNHDGVVSQDEYLQR